jgi:hypothetical protein
LGEALHGDGDLGPAIAALDLSLPTAVAQVQEWREKAGLLDWYCSVTVPGFVYVFRRNDYGFGYIDYDIEASRPGGRHRAEYATKLEAIRAAKEAENASK